MDLKFELEKNEKPEAMLVLRGIVSLLCANSFGV